MPCVNDIAQSNRLRTGTLPVSNLHRLYYEESATRQGSRWCFCMVVRGLVLSRFYRTFFDPQRFHAVIFSQRGAPKSLPLGELDAE